MDHFWEKKEGSRGQKEEGGREGGKEGASHNRWVTFLLRSSVPSVVPRPVGAGPAAEARLSSGFLYEALIHSPSLPSITFRDQNQRP